MKKILLVLVALMIATTMYAVDASKMTDAGAKALLFDATWVNAGTYDGGFGMKYYLSNGLALRPVLKFGYVSSTTKKDPDSTGVPAAMYHNTYKDGTDKTMSFGLDLAVEKTMLSMNAVNINVGVGGMFGLSSETIESGTTTTETNAGVAIDWTQVATSKTERSSTNFGGGLLLGAEWFLTENISLGAEYQFGLSMQNDNKDQITTTGSYTTGGVTTTTTTTTKTPLVKKMTLGIQTAGLVLGIRF